MALTEAEAALIDGPIVWGTYDAVNGAHGTYDVAAAAHPTYDTSGFVGAGQMRVTSNASSAHMEVGA